MAAKKETVEASEIVENTESCTGANLIWLKLRFSRTATGTKMT